MQDIVLESIARNTKFLDIETDYVTEMLDSLNISHPPNIFTEYTSLEYNELANQLQDSEGEVQDLIDQINGLNIQIMQIQDELANAFQMLEYESGMQGDLEDMIQELIMERMIFETQLYAMMEELATMETQFIDVVEDNATLQSELGASQVLINTLQADFNTALSNEVALQGMIENLQVQLSSSNHEIAQLQQDLVTTINNLVQEVAMGQSIQDTLQQELNDSTSQISTLLSQITQLESSLAISQQQLDDNTINQADVTYFENQIAQLNQTNQALIQTIQEMEVQTGQTATDLSSGVVDVQGKIDMKTGRGTIQLLKSRPKTPEKIRQAGKKLRFA